ncbi:hypothetical protein CKM354_000426300 [Cercospora kikuchii]|uniref:Uncharacterized protein n=1 Tax=Cercospora kikuchii TaxID=84275 RepID=A0A9P3CDT3_9PEZI|nr:uncharacterized protein CKM354_000426300 [Cercospora kikuchii]GIZ40943.1 hypothetical protein CKM354_000426300 [Cercospora kikuchii]
MVNSHATPSEQQTQYITDGDGNVVEVQVQDSNTTTKPSSGKGKRSSRAKNNPDVRNVRRLGNAEALEKEASRRWIEYGFLVDDFDSKTKISRSWFTTSQAHKSLREAERARLRKEIPRLGAELEKCREEMEQMNEADRDWEVKYGTRCEQGEWDAVKLEKYRGYLRMDHDEVPDLREGGEEGE